MKRIFLALLLAACMLLSGCNALDVILDYARQMQEERAGLNENRTSEEEPEDKGPTFTQMVEEYRLPDMEKFQTLLDRCCQVAETSGDSGEVMDAVEEYYAFYDDFYTALHLADIRYCLDLSDAGARQDYEFCMDASARVEEGLEKLYDTLSRSAIKDKLERMYFGLGFFEDYGEESAGDEESYWPQEYMDLLNREAELITLYYQRMDEASGISVHAADYYERVAGLVGPVMVDLITVRQELAAYMEYEDYESFAWDWYYYRDYTPDEAAAHVEQIREKLVPLYVELQEDGFYGRVYSQYYDEEDCLEYMSSAARNMGDIVWEAYRCMQAQELYDISPSETKFEGSFEVYLPSYGVPFVLVNPYGDISDLGAFAHEFGHFTNDYATDGSYLSSDTAEIMSQAMEWMAVCYADGPNQRTLELARHAKLAETLSTLVEQAAYHCFESAIYQIPQEELSVERIHEVYSQVARDFGFDSVGWDPAEWVTVPHFFTQPFYVLSYVVSGDAAMQVYELEQAEEGAGLELYRNMVYEWEDVPFMTFIEDQGLRNPLDTGRVDEMARCFREDLLEMLR